MHGHNHWKSPEVEFLCTSLFTKMVVFLLGGFSWYFMATWHIVEGSLLRRRSRNHPYTHASAGCGVLRVSPVPTINMRKYGISLEIVIGDISLVSASSNVALRAYTLWRDNTWARLGIATCTLVHLVFAILVGAMSYKPRWDSSHTFCNLLSTEMQNSLTGLYIYTTVWDFVILTLTITGLRRQHLPSQSPLRAVLLTQGVLYAIVTCLTCIPVTLLRIAIRQVVVLLDLNDAMNIFLSVPSCTFSVVASSAAVTHLLNMKHGSSGNPISRHASPDHATTSTGGSQLTTNIEIAGFRLSDDLGLDETKTHELSLGVESIDHRADAGHI
ncbi:hypothetical protein BDW22DRAFT_1347006 [Trametopsis cervina]|nr:hypothetical protein BDW22DRAFT_1347006 [Trametopsis cervina]